MKAHIRLADEKMHALLEKTNYSNPLKMFCNLGDRDIYTYDILYYIQCMYKLHGKENFVEMFNNSNAKKLFSRKNTLN